MLLASGRGCALCAWEFASRVRPPDVSSHDLTAHHGMIVQQATPQELRQFREGDYYLPGKTKVQQPTARQLRRFREGDYYAPEVNN